MPRKNPCSSLFMSPERNCSLELRPSDLFFLFQCRIGEMQFWGVFYCWKYNGSISRLQLFSLISCNRQQRKTICTLRPCRPTTFIDSLRASEKTEIASVCTTAGCHFLIAMVIPSEKGSMQISTRWSRWIFLLSSCMIGVADLGAPELKTVHMRNT